MTDTSFIVYKAANTINGKVYIGITGRSLERRIRDHWDKHGKYPFAAALRKYGRLAFAISVIEESLTREDAAAREQHWIRVLDCKAPNGYNLTDGGDGVSGMSGEVREKIAASRRGKPLSVEHRAAVSATLMGNIPWNKGRKLSAEHRARLVTSHLGKCQTEETKRKRSDSLRAAHKRLGNKWNHRPMLINEQGQFIKAID